MPIHKWKLRRTKHFGDVWVPFADVELQTASGTWIKFAVQVDSGATVSLLRRSVADLLEIPLESGRRVELGSVGSGTTECYVHDLPVRFDKNIQLTAPFAIATTESVPNLLGRLGIFDQLQVDFDATLRETRIASRWLTDNEREQYERLLEVDDQIVKHLREGALPGWGGKASDQLLRRGGQLAATAFTLMKYNRSHEGLLIIRALFEHAAQLDYLLRDPPTRGRLYLDYSFVSQHKMVKAGLRGDLGPSAQGEWTSSAAQQKIDQIKSEYDRVAPQFEKESKNGKKFVSDRWYGMGLADLCARLDAAPRPTRPYKWLPEHRYWYVMGSGWIHGDPLHTETPSPFFGNDAEVLFWKALCYYSRMLLSVADAGKIVLTGDVDERLRKLATGEEPYT